MSFKDKHGITKLPTNRDTERLSISYDTNDEKVNTDLSNAYAVVLHVPYVPDHSVGIFAENNHDHITLTDPTCLELYIWLGEYLKAKGLLK